ncbi:cytochrome b561 and DOMON domain-containing protein [Cocos nucifera]|uniref:Cytochrome b561 and DOMON domain-containing protein n=1 Tax=Cocos nucifera TaxID=13894 RepID=A0A8K0IVB7_COCNU|nr:cytochrome b561 and DOMON domain-containing protein [Cocos nucifera]
MRCSLVVEDHSSSVAPPTTVCLFILGARRTRHRRKNNISGSTHSNMTLLSALVVLVLASSLAHRTKAQWHSCDSGFSISATAVARNITQCRRLQTLGAELGINNYSTTPNSSTIDVVFSALPPTPQGWIAWGVNPGRHPQMVGTRVLIAYNQPSGMPVVGTYNVTADTRRGCKLEPSTIEVGVANKAANYSGETGRLTMAARLTLPPEYSVSKLNHVWQVGPRVVGMVPSAHAKTLENFDSKERMDLARGVGHGQRHHEIGLREAHGILSAIGWGTLLPIGVIVSRYFRGSPINTKKIWFYTHVGIQILAFSLGVAAWGIGLSLMERSGQYRAFMGHRIIGILIFCLATLQMMALWLKPKLLDKYRKYWNIYHHFVGYSLIVLVIVNIFKGFAILKPSAGWKWAYIGILIGLSCVALGLEISIWIVFFQDNKNASTKTSDPSKPN